MTQKTCSRCNTEKPIAEFRVRSDRVARGDKWNARCRPCEKQANAESYQRRKVRDSEYARRVSDTSKLKKYGLTIEDYDRMFAEQGGKCAICGSDKGAKDKRLAVDHCHVTGRVRALLCFRCNSGLGQFGDKPDLLIGAAAYLIQHEGVREASR